MQLVNNREPPQSQQILRATAVAGTPALPAPDVGQGLLDRDALTHLRASRVNAERPNEADIHYADAII